MNENPHRIVADAAGAVDQTGHNQPTAPPDFLQSHHARVDCALAYARRGWAPIPIPERKKAPLIRGWQKLQISETDLPAHFDGRGNIGIILGLASGRLTDVDLDCLEAIEFAANVLPATCAIFGRASKPGAHWLYRVEGRAPTMKFSDPITGAALLEIRGDGGLQTVFPPSVHPTGEVIEWAQDGEPTMIESAVLIERARRLAGCCLIKRYCHGVTGAASLAAALDTVDPRVADRVREWLALPRVTSERPSELGEILPGPIPDYIQSRPSRGLANSVLRNLGPEWSALAEIRVRSALSYIPANSYETWYKIGMILQSLRWIRSDGSDIGDEIWDEWSQRSPKYPGVAALQAKWQSFGKAGRGGLGLGTLFQWARQQGWSDTNNQSSGGTNGAPNGDTAQSTNQSDSAGGNRTQRDSTEENQFGNKPPPSRLEIISMDEVEGQNIDFLWPNRLALGKHSALAGIGGKGKSQVLYSTAAIITTGARWPCGEGHAPQGSVVLLSAEDDIADMMQPRLIAAGANLKRVKAIKAVVEGTGKKKRFNLLADLQELYRACRELGDVVMVGIDPLGSYLGADLDTHRDAALRSALDPISEMASAARCSVFSVMHFNKATSMKTAMDRVMGGAGFVNAPRCALGLLVDPDDENKRMLLGLKTNIGPMPQGLRMHLEMAGAGTDKRTGRPIQATRVVWDGQTDLTADAVVAMMNERETPKLDGAIAFLRSELKDGPRPVEGVKSHATALGISTATLKRAREEIGVIARQIKGSAHGGWEYLLAVGSI